MKLSTHRRRTLCIEHYKLLICVGRFWISFKHPQINQSPVQSAQGNRLLTMQWWLRKHQSFWKTYKKDFLKKQIKKILQSCDFILADGMTCFCLGHHNSGSAHPAQSRKNKRSCQNVWQVWVSSASTPHARVSVFPCYTIETLAHI